MSTGNEILRPRLRPLMKGRIFRNATPKKIEHLLVLADSIAGYTNSDAHPRAALYYTGFPTLMRQLCRGRFEFVPCPAQRATFTTTPTDGDTVTTGAKTYTFRTANPGTDEVLIGGSATAACANLNAKLQTDPSVYSGAKSTIIQIVSKTPGWAGADTVFTKSCSAITIDGPTSTSGTLTLNEVWSFGGRTAAELVSEGRVDQALAHVPNKATTAILLEAGANDVVIHNNASTVAANVLACADAIKAGGVRVIVAEIPDRGDETYDSVIVAANATIKAGCAARGYPFIEWRSAMDSDADDFIAGDDVHPSVIGQIKMGVVAAAKVAPLLAPFAARTIESPNSTLPGTISGTSFVPTGWAIAKDATVTAVQRVAAADGGNDWLEFTLTSDASKRYFTINLAAAVTSFPKTYYRATADMEVEVVSGKQRLLSYTAALRTAGASSQWWYDGATGTPNETKLDGSAYAFNTPAMRSESRWVRKNYTGTWTGLTPYFRAVLGPNSVIKFRIRDAGFEGKD